MSLADTITQLGSSIINVITKGIQGVADYINDNIGNVPDADGTSLSMYTFVNETAVDTLETTSKTIVGSINELKESSGGGGDVTAAGNNTFTGMNIFKGSEGLCVGTDSNYSEVARFVETENGIDSDKGSEILTYMALGSSYSETAFEGTPFVQQYDSEQSKEMLYTMFHAGNLLAGDGVSIARNGAEYTISATGSSVDIATTISADSTDTQVPSAKCVYDLIGDVETLLSEV